MNLGRWVRLGQYWKQVAALAEQRHGQKVDFRSSNHWTSGHNTHFVGLCGEVVVSLLTGWKVDRELRVSGDPGYDFERGGFKYDVKAATHSVDPHLKEFPDKRIEADILLLVGLDMRLKQGRLVGWLTAGQVLGSPLRDYGHGKMLSATEKEIVELWGQPGLPDVALPYLKGGRK